MTTKTIKMLVGSLLFVSVAGCETFAGLVVAPQPTARLAYQNPPRPQPVLPTSPRLKTMTEWQAAVRAGEVRASGLVCMTHNDSLNLLGWLKNVAQFERDALRSIEFHERMNASGPESVVNPDASQSP